MSFTGHNPLATAHVPTAPAAPDTPATDPIADRRTAALDIEARQHAERVAPEPPTGGSVEPPPAEPPADPNALPTLDELPALIQKRHEERLANEQAEQDRRELEMWRAQRGATVPAPPEPADSAAVAQAYFDALPPGQKREYLRDLATKVTATPAVQALTPQLQALEEQVKGVQNVLTTQQQADQAARDAKLEAEFQTFTGNEDAYPALATLPPAERLRLGYGVMKQYRAAGVEITDAQIAAHLNEVEQEKIDRIIARHTGGAPQQGAAQASAPTTPAFGRTQAPDSPATLTNAHAAAAPLRAPSTPEERREAARRIEASQRAKRRS